MVYEISSFVFNTTTPTLISFPENHSPRSLVSPSSSSSSASTFLPSKLHHCSKHETRRVAPQNLKPHTLLHGDRLWLGNGLVYGFAFESYVCHYSLDLGTLASSVSSAQVGEQKEVEIVEGYTMTEICDRMIDVFMNEKTKSKEWRKYLVFREEWNKYKDSFYRRCQKRADTENDPIKKQKFVSLWKKMKKIDDEMEEHNDLLKEVQDSPTDINVIVARRRKDFTGEFFRYLSLLSDTYDSLEDRDAIARLGTRCLSAVSAYDNILEIVDTLDPAQAKFDDILNSPSIDVACEKIKSLAKAKELDSSLVLLINSAWAKAKESPTLKNEVKDIMYRLYKTTKSSLRSMAPKEIKLLKHLLNIVDPEERFSALATAFSPGGKLETKDPDALYTTPKELHKWVKIMLDAYHLNKEETELREAKQITQPVVIQRLFILKETIEEEYLEKSTFQKSDTEKGSKSEEEEEQFYP